MVGGVPKPQFMNRFTPFGVLFFCVTAWGNEQPRRVKALKKLSATTQL
jgi:hypothetical protein